MTVGDVKKKVGLILEQISEQGWARQQRRLSHIRRNREVKAGDKVMKKEEDIFEMEKQQQS